MRSACHRCCYTPVCWRQSQEWCPAECECRVDACNILQCCSARRVCLSCLKQAQVTVHCPAHCRVVVKDELDSLLANKQLAASAPLLVFANKQDLPTALTASEVAQALQLDSIKDKPWQITSSNAVLGQGLDNGMEWLAQALQRQLQI